jgi:hypothetical protein
VSGTGREAVVQAVAADLRGPAQPIGRHDNDLPDRIAAFQKQIDEMRRDHTDTLRLVELLREQCLAVETKMLAAEQEHARLLKQLADCQAKLDQ